MPSIRDFSGGVLNQELQNRDSGNGVLFDCKNVLSSWNGELRKRTGTRWLKSLEGNSKIIPYRLPNGDDMIMLLKDGKLECYSFDDNNNLIPYYIYDYGDDMNFPTTGWISNTQGDWTVSGNGGSALVEGLPEENPYIAFSTQKGSSAYQYKYVYDTLVVEGGDANYVFYNATDAFVFYSCHVVWTTDLLFPLNNKAILVAGDEPIIQYSDDGTNWTGVKTKQMNPKYSSVSGNTECVYTYSYDIMCDAVVQPHKYWRIVFASVMKKGIYTSGLCYTALSLSNMVCRASVEKTILDFNGVPFNDNDLNNLRWSQNDTSLMIASKGKQPYQIKIEDGEFVGGVFLPSDYTGLWSAVGYPACVTYYQNRLWFGGFDLFPTRVYASAFGEFDKFTIPNPIIATSPIIADGTEISNIIENMWGGNNALYCLSADGISMIDAQGAIVAADQVEFKLRNREPVDSMVPTVKDDIMIYLGRDKRKILVTDYDFVVQRFRANCISDNYNNFLQGGVKELHYIPRKSSLIYGVLGDGKWFAQLFSTDKSKNSLYPFETSGAVVDVQPIKIGDETKLLMITQLPTAEYILEEKLPQPDQEIMDFMSVPERQDYTKKVIENDCYLDHAISRQYDVPTTEIGNLPYLEGDKLEVIADGKYLGKKEVVRNGNTGYNEIILEEPVSKVVLGYSYDSYAVLKFVSPYNMRKFPKEISVNFINSGYAELGNTFESLKPVLHNIVDSVTINNKPILMNGNYTMTLDKQTFETPYVIIRSDKGLPFIITGIDYKVDMSNYQGGV